MAHTCDVPPARASGRAGAGHARPTRGPARAVQPGRRRGRTAMKIANTLTVYLARQFLGWLLAAVGLAAAVILLFDSLELMRRAASRPTMTLEVVGEVALLRLPSLIQTVLPICVLFGAIAAFWRLTRSRELVVARASGVSVWQFLAPALALALLVGIFKVVLIGPVASSLLAKAGRHARDHNPAARGPYAVGASGGWVGESGRRSGARRG